MCVHGEVDACVCLRLHVHACVCVCVCACNVSVCMVSSHLNPAPPFRAMREASFASHARSEHTQKEASFSPKRSHQMSVSANVGLRCERIFEDLLAMQNGGIRALSAVPLPEMQMCAMPNLLAILVEQCKPPRLQCYDFGC